MLSKLKLKSTTSMYDEKTQWYELDGISIMVSISNKFQFIDNVKKTSGNKTKSVITVSFSNKNKPISQNTIISCLHFFGFNVDDELYVKYIPFMDYADMEMVDCYGFEQLVENNIKAKVIIKLMGKPAEAEKSVKESE